MVDITREVALRLARSSGVTEPSSSALNRFAQAANDLSKCEIEQLTARVRELEEENARLKFALADTEALELGTSERLAASQAYAEQLRVAIDRVRSGAAALGLDRIFDIATEALALPRDTSALDAHVAKRLHDMACDKGLLRIQVEELTRQRDLAVEAMRESLECGEDGDWQSARRILDSAIKESGGK